MSEATELSRWILPIDDDPGRFFFRVVSEAHQIRRNTKTFDGALEKQPRKVRAEFLANDTACDAIAATMLASKMADAESRGDVHAAIMYAVKFGIVFGRTHIHRLAKDGQAHRKAAIGRRKGHKTQQKNRKSRGAELRKAASDLLKSSPKLSRDAAAARVAVSHGANKKTVLNYTPKRKRKK